MIVIQGISAKNIFKRRRRVTENLLEVNIFEIDTNPSEKNGYAPFHVSKKEKDSQSLAVHSTVTQYTARKRFYHFCVSLSPNRTKHFHQYTIQ